MMPDRIPAWKRIGLKVKEELSEDPLAVTTHLESAKLTQKQTKKLKKQKRSISELNDESETATKEKRAAKRVKLPKDKRPAPPEKDQLVYLKAYHEDRDNWKFSKQKQNWILRNIKEIPKEYEEALGVYLKGIQGGSKDRIIEELKEVIKKWNQIAEAAELRIQKKLEDIAAGVDVEGNEKDAAASKGSKQVEADSQAPVHDYVIKARNLIKALTDEDIELKAVDQESEDEESSENTEGEDEEMEVKEVATEVEKQKEEKSNPETVVGSPITNSNGIIENNKKENKKEKKKDKSKEAKKENVEENKKEDMKENIKGKKNESNVIIETLEVSDFINDEDLKDPVPKYSRLDNTKKRRRRAKGKKNVEEKSEEK